MARRARKARPAEAALKGALSGLVAGAAVLVAERAAERKLLGRRATVETTWGDLIDDAAHGIGVRLSSRQRSAAAIGAHLAFSSVLGAVYGLTQSRVGPEGPADGLVQAGLAYGSFIATRAMAPRTTPRLRVPALRARQRLVERGAQGLFAATTAAAFRALMR